MKHILIGGSCRSGKTTLSLMLRKEGFNHYKMDSIKRGLDDNFCKKAENSWKKLSPKMAHLIKTMIDESFTDKTRDIEYYVIDTCHLYPKDIAKLNLKDTVIIFLGYPNLTIEEKFKMIRENDYDYSWTSFVSDEVIKKGLKLDLKYSKDCKKQCEENNIKFFDTGNNFNEIIKEAYEYLIKEAK